MPLLALHAGLAGIYKNAAVTPPQSGLPYDPPVGWVKTFEDDFTQPATTGVNAIDGSKWKQRSFGTGLATGGAAYNNGGNNLQSTGTTARFLTTRVNNTWYVDGIQQGFQNSDPGGFGYAAGYGEFHVRFRSRFSQLYMPGIGGLALMWPATNKWTSEIDILETPGTNKNQALSVIHYDSRGLKDLGSNNEQNGQFQYPDMSVYHVWDCRRIYTIGADGITRATIRVWIDGVQTPVTAAWTNNQWLTEPMVPGIASYVNSPGWDAYTYPDNTTPISSYLEVDYFYIWEPSGTTPTPGTSKSISLSPVSPGSLTESSPGAGVTWTTNVNTVGITSISWVVVSPGTFAFRDAVVTVPTTGTVQIKPVFKNSGEFVKVFEAGDINRSVDSGQVTLVAGTQTRTLNFSPRDPGTRPAGTLTTTVTTTGISSITWVVVNGDYSWTSGGTTVPTTGSVVINPNFTATGQFLKVFDANDIGFAADGGQITIA